MKKSILVTLLTVLLICTACGQSSPEKALDNYLKEMISTGQMPESNSDDFDLSAFLQKVEYDITGSTVNDDTAKSTSRSPRPTSPACCRNLSYRHLPRLSPALMKQILTPSCRKSLTKRLLLPTRQS